MYNNIISFITDASSVSKFHIKVFRNDQMAIEIEVRVWPPRFELSPLSLPLPEKIIRFYHRFISKEQKKKIKYRFNHRSTRKQLFSTYKKNLSVKLYFFVTATFVTNKRFCHYAVTKKSQKILSPQKVLVNKRLCLTKISHRIQKILIFDKFKFRYQSLGYDNFCEEFKFHS